MKISGGKIFLVVTVLIMAFAYYDFHKSAREESDKLVANRVYPNRSVEEVASFKIHSIFGEIAVEAKGDKWQMIAPVQDSADTLAVNTYLSSLLNQEMKKVETDSGIDWPQYGLDKPDGWVEVTFKDNKRVLIQVGTVRAISDGHYLRQDTGGSLFVGDAEWTTLVNRPPAEFRDKSMFEFEPSSMTEVSLQHKETLGFSKKENAWVLTSPAPPQGYELDQTKVSDFTIVLSNFKVDLFAAENKSDLKPFGIEKPHLEVVVKSGADERRVVFANGKAGKIFVTSSARAGLFEVSRDKVKSLLKTAQDFDKEKKPDLNKEDEIKKNPEPQAKEN